ncbi:Transcriptional regulatory protein WalR [compost metagenome]
MLGGEISVYSVTDKGSTFNLYLPLDSEYLDMEPKPKYVPEVIDVAAPKRSRRFDQSIDNEIVDDRENIHPGDRVFLIIEDDQKFSEILLHVLRKKGFKAVITSKGSKALELAHKYKPVAITLDLLLNDMDGSLVIEQLKNDISVRHIPVCVITVEEKKVQFMQKGIYDYICKPVTNEDLENALNKLNNYADKTLNHLLIVVNDEERRKQYVEQINSKDIKISSVNTGQKALNQLKTKEFDCVMVDNDLPDMNVIQFVRDMQKTAKNKSMPVVMNTLNKLSDAEEYELEELFKTAVIKEVNSLHQIIDATTLFLHRKMDNLPDKARELLVQIHQSDEMIDSKKVLVVDDDIRNIFALATILERHNMNVISAENGQDAIDLLENTPNIEIVLMDIMMPVMDGYETIRAIRKKAEFKDLPIIALTAKAMKGDREQCLEAGASDYITKPVNSSQLLSMIRSWFKTEEEEEAPTAAPGNTFSILK